MSTEQSRFHLNGTATVYFPTLPENRETRKSYHLQMRNSNDVSRSKFKSTHPVSGSTQPYQHSPCVQTQNLVSRGWFKHGCHAG